MRYDIIDNDTLIVTPYKHKFLSYILDNHILKNVKFMSLDEFIKYVFFDYDEKTIYYVMKNYNMTYYSSLEYIKSLYYIKENMDNQKIKFLYNLKQDLISNNLLYFNKVNYKNIIIYGYKYIDMYYKNEFKKYNVKYIDYEYKNNCINDIYMFNDIYDEVSFVSEQIKELIYSGININNIKLLNLNDDYRIEIRKIFSLNNIPFTDIKIYLYELEEVKKFLNNMDLSVIKDNYIYEKVVNILNKYMWANLSDVKELIEEEFKKTSINKNYENEVKEVSIDSIKDTDYVFLLNYHSDSIPIIYKDLEYIEDDLKEKLGIYTSYIKTQNSKEELKSKLASINNLIISCNKDNHISNLFDNVEIKEYKNKYNYSNKFNNYNLGRMLDTYYKYGEKSYGLDIIYEKSNLYKKYNNKFKGIDKLELNKYLNNKVSLSYTKLDTYYKCGFKYYINYILKIDKYDITFKTYIGNISHYILSKCFNSDFNLDKEFSYYLNTYKKDLTNKEMFFIHKVKKELEFIINELKNQNKYISLNNALYEKKIIINKGDNYFEGVIDKLLYDNDTMAIIDYKTGNQDINMSYIKYGLGMQLPIYIYLSKKYFNKEVAGFYLQNILNNTKTMDIKEKKDSLKLQGYSNSNIEILRKIDNEYSNSYLIKGLKETKNGFNSYSKLFNNDDLENIIKITDSKIDECFKHILNGEFEINPKIVDKDNISCKYCKYKDICFKKDKDNIYIKGDNDEIY